MPKESHDPNAAPGLLLKTPSEAPTMDLPRRLDAEAVTCPIPSTAALPAEAGAPIPSRLGTYRIIGPLGGGGMGEVYEAFDEALDRPAAIKVIARKYSCEPTMFERLQIEARAAARLSHPNIVTVFQLGLEGDVAFIAMERVTGETLASLIRARGSLPIGEALRITRQAAAGLAHAAQQKVIHRDIKPSNLMVLPDGTVKVLDFGLAKRLESSDPSLTDTNCRIGTPLYMAPEQALGEPVDLRADIYALGVTLYNALVGRPPFEASSPVAAAVKHATAPIEYPPELRNAHGGRVAELIDWMTAKEATRRPASYAELATRLDELIRESESGATTRRWRNPALLITALACLLGVAAMVGVVVRHAGSGSALQGDSPALEVRGRTPTESAPKDGQRPATRRPPRLGDRLRNLGEATDGLPAREAMRMLGRTLKEREVLASICLEGDLDAAIGKLRAAHEDESSRRPLVERMAIADLEAALASARAFDRTLGAELLLEQRILAARQAASGSPEETRAHAAVLYLMAVSPEDGLEAWSEFVKAHPDAMARPELRGPVALLGFLHGGPLQ